MPLVIDTKHYALFLTGLILSPFGCVEEAPLWEGEPDAALDNSTDVDSSGADTGLDTGTTGDSDTDTGPLPPGVTTAAKGTASTINGLLDEPAWDISNPVTRAIEGRGNNNILFGALWDNFYLYIGVAVEDPNLHNDSLMTWQDDSVEVFIDGDNSKSTKYDEHDFMYWLEYGSNIMTVTDGQPMNALHTVKATDGGYAAELAVPWTDLKVTPSSGMRIGLDIGVNDDDNGDDRDAHYMWNGTDDNHKDTSSFGTLVLL
jgi:hypothetical protein